MAAVAEALFLTPSAVSQQIAQLEEEVGMPLTERQGRGVRLTPAGERLVAHAERILIMLDEAKSDLAEIKREIAGVLRVAAFPTVAAALLPQAIQALQASYPHLDIVFKELEPADGLAALGSWNVDVAFVDNLTNLLVQKYKNIDQVPLIEDVLYVLLPQGHRLAQRQSLAVSDLRGERWALDSAVSFYGEFILNLCRRAGYEPRVNAECRGFEVVREMVASGCSISIIPGLRRVNDLAGVSAVKLRPEARRRISVAFRHGERNHPAVKVFLDQMVLTAKAVSEATN
ncbi:DNA-binding transcriptional LysR family regulator [Variovorax ginsengisoli]|uniref:DNA-binding transcriptional LysR family regulator n=2 Tax=Variovorax ginsengisoli TaxID=363844 RepID=A0ABT9SF59_9BURK|nr:DNA-binding transcriptional LysR family regulator [Variovorax ginsengisoli]